MMKKTLEDKLEDAVNDLGLDKIYKEFFSNPGTSKYNHYCEVAFSKKEKTNAEAKEICSKLLYFLEKIYGNKGNQESSKYCSYLRYWLYDEIGKNYEHTKKVSAIPFVRELINTGNKAIRKHFYSRCNILPQVVRTVDFNEYRRRKFLHMYFKNHEKIKQISRSKNKDQCSKCLAYINVLSSLYERYRKINCDRSIWLPFSYAPHYFYCRNLYNPKNLITELKECSSIETSSVSTSADHPSTGYTDPIAKSAADHEPVTQNDFEERVGDDATSKNDVSDGGTEEKGVTKEVEITESKEDSLDSVEEEDQSDWLDTEEQEVALGSEDIEHSQDLSGSQSLLPQIILTDEQDQRGRVDIPQDGIEQDTEHQEQFLHKEDMDISTYPALPEMVPNFYISHKKKYDTLNSGYIRYTVIGVTIFCAVIFLINFFKSTLPGSGPSKKGIKKKKKRGYENNYYDKHQELSRYILESPPENSKMKRVHLLYETMGDYIY
ncbi:variable surface protein [Plasmodium gonderi]|uniref:Variable surface protein n=1 Tax=Plasmodium gonderi TaxID=77519 RepID=A0A1Y1JBF9_PLAGO|nr:variable surface protein [Plasmodium gonderi]GAW79859.1 variable surface protein [Plasmodium gonderi]